MKSSLFFILIALMSAAVQAEPVITIPKDRVTAGYAIPIKIDLSNENRKQFDINIMSDGINLIQVSASGDVDIRSVSTRFQALSANVGVSVASLGTPLFKTDRTLDLPAPAVIPDDQAMVMAIIGKTSYTFIRAGKEVQTKNSSGRFAFFVENAVSRKHFVNEVDIELVKGEQRATVSIKGSPYWFEPLMVLEGDFDTAKVIRIVAD
jgi:hypothetical protein